MPPLANQRHERFSQLIALGSSPRSAYIECGFKDSKFSRPNASKLRHSPKVSARVAELLREWGDACKVQLSWVQHELLAIAEGRAVSRTMVNAKGERTEEWDRLAALSALLKSLGVGDTDVSVNFTLAERLDAAIKRVKTINVTPEPSRPAPSAAPSIMPPEWRNLPDRL